jgi:hypothetical protein
MVSNLIPLAWLDAHRCGLRVAPERDKAPFGTPAKASPALFITSTGQRARQRGVAETFARLVVLAGIATPPGQRRPRVHDLRHYADA